MNISIVIPTYNRVDLLMKTIESILNQITDGSFQYEVYVVDDNSTDTTRYFIDNKINLYTNKLHYIKGVGKGVAQARNLGVEAANGEWIAFTDDDQIAESNWLMSLVDAARRHNLRCVAGKRLLLLPERVDIPLDSRLRVFFGEDIWGIEERMLNHEELPNTGNILINISVFNQVGIFDSSLLYGGEDTEFFMRVRAAGIPILYSPNAIVHHIIFKNRMSEDYIKVRAHHNGISKAIINFKHGKYVLLIKELFKWLLLSILRRHWFFQFSRSPEDNLYGKYMVWYSWGYSFKAFEIMVPWLFKNSKFLNKKQFRNINTN